MSVESEGATARDLATGELVIRSIGQSLQRAINSPKQDSNSYQTATDF
jgi:hypothetical protein